MAGAGNGVQTVRFLFSVESGAGFKRRSKNGKRQEARIGGRRVRITGANGGITVGAQHSPTRDRPEGGTYSCWREQR